MRTLGLLAALVVLAAACADGGEDDGRMPPQGAPSLLDGLLALPVTDDREALRAVAATGDRRYIAALVELLRFPWEFTGETQDEIVRAAAQLAGLGEPSFEHEDWGWWVEWLGAQPGIGLPEGFASYKGNLLAVLVGPDVGGFLRDDLPARIRIEEIAWGGVNRDGIPDLRDPPHVAPERADYLRDDDRVFGVSINGEHRAYPLRVMNPHEMANDVLGGVPIALAYCTLCGTGIVYRAEVDGERVEFGTSGLLYRSNKLMYDRRTLTLWEHLSGTPAVGPLAARDITLEALPSVLTTWGAWRAEHPDTTVLDDDTGVYPASVYRPEDDPDSAYYTYRQSPDPIFPVWQRNSLLDDKAIVFGIAAGGEARAWPLDALARDRVVNDDVGGTSVVLVNDGTQTGVRAFEREERAFRLGPDGGLVDDAGTRWRVTEDALVADADGTRLDRISGRTTYWFAWFAFFPRTSAYGFE